MREFTNTEQLILAAKEQFDKRMLRENPPREERLTQWVDFLTRWHDDLIAIGWRRWEIPVVKP